MIVLFEFIDVTFLYVIIQKIAFFIHRTDATFGDLVDKKTDRVDNGTDKVIPLNVYSKGTLGESEDMKITSSNQAVLSVDKNGRVNSSEQPNGELNEGSSVTRQIQIKTAPSVVVGKQAANGRESDSNVGNSLKDLALAKDKSALATIKTEDAVQKRLSCDSEQLQQFVLQMQMKSSKDEKSFTVACQEDLITNVGHDDNATRAMPLVSQMLPSEAEENSVSEEASLRGESAKPPLSGSLTCSPFSERGRNAHLMKQLKNESERIQEKLNNKEIGRRRSVTTRKEDKSLSKDGDKSPLHDHSENSGLTQPVLDMTKSTKVLSTPASPIKIASRQLPPTPKKLVRSVAVSNTSDLLPNAINVNTSASSNFSFAPFKDSGSTTFKESGNDCTVSQNRTDLKIDYNTSSNIIASASMKGLIIQDITSHNPSSSCLKYVVDDLYVAPLEVRKNANSVDDLQNSNKKYESLIAHTNELHATNNEMCHFKTVKSRKQIPIKSDHNFISKREGVGEDLVRNYSYVQQAVVNNSSISKLNADATFENNPGVCDNITDNGNQQDSKFPQNGDEDGNDMDNSRGIADGESPRHELLDEHGNENRKNVHCLQNESFLQATINLVVSSEMSNIKTKQNFESDFLLKLEKNDVDDAAVTLTSQNYSKTCDLCIETKENCDSQPIKNLDIDNNNHTQLQNQLPTKSINIHLLEDNGYACDVKDIELLDNIRSVCTSSGNVTLCLPKADGPIALPCLFQENDTSINAVNPDVATVRSDNDVILNHHSEPIAPTEMPALPLVVQLPNVVNRALPLSTSPLSSRIPRPPASHVRCPVTTDTFRYGQTRN